MESLGGYFQAVVLTLLCLDRLISFIRFRTNFKKNGSNNPHTTAEYVHEAITERTAEMKNDIKTLEKQVNKIDKDVGILISRDPSLRSRAND